MDRKTISLMGLALLGILFSSSVFVVKETERALMLQFGRNREAGHSPGASLGSCRSSTRSKSSMRAY